MSFHVQRDRFDQILLENSEKYGAEVRYDTKVISVDFSIPDFVKVQTQDAQTIQTKFIIDATGQDAFLGKVMGTKRKQPHLSQRIALSTHWKNARLDSTLKSGSLRIITLEGKKKGWIWMIPVAEDRLSVGVVTELEYFKDQKRLHSEHSEDWLTTIYKEEVYSSALGLQVLEHSEMLQEIAVNSDYSFDVKEKWADRFAIIGDAGSFLDPMFASGVYLAMKSAMLVTDALEKKTKNGDLRAMNEAYLQISGAYRLLEKMITTFYDPDAIKFPDLDKSETANYEKLDAVFGMMHLILAGDFFSNHKKYLDSIDVLTDKKSIDRFKHLTAQTQEAILEFCKEKS